MAQIEGLNLVYWNPVTESAAKCRYHENFRFEGPSPPPKSEKFLEIFSQFSQNPYSWSTGVIFDHLTILPAISDQSRAK